MDRYELMIYFGWVILVLALLLWAAYTSKDI